MPSLIKIGRLVRIATLPETRRAVVAAARSESLRDIARRAATDRAALARDLMNPANAREVFRSALRHPASRELGSASLLFMPGRYVGLGWVAGWAADRNHPQVRRSAGRCTRPTGFRSAAQERDAGIWRRSGGAATGRATARDASAVRSDEPALARPPSTTEGLERQARTPVRAHQGQLRGSRPRRGRDRGVLAEGPRGSGRPGRGSTASIRLLEEAVAVIPSRLPTGLPAPGRARSSRILRLRRA